MDKTVSRLPSVDARVEAGSKRQIVWSLVYVGVTIGGALVLSPASLSRAALLFQDGQKTMKAALQAVVPEPSPVTPVAVPQVKQTPKPAPVGPAVAAASIPAAAVSVVPPPPPPAPSGEKGEAVGLAPTSESVARAVTIAPPPPVRAKDIPSAPVQAKPDTKAPQHIAGFAVAAGDVARIRVGDQMVSLAGVLPDRSVDKVAALSAILNGAGNMVSCQVQAKGYLCALGAQGPDLAQRLIQGGFARPAR